MHSPFVPGRSQRLKWWWEDLRSARLSLGLAAVLLAIQGALSGVGSTAELSRIYEVLGLSRQGVEQGFVWQLASHGFLHGGWTHAGMNILLLVATGARVERIHGWKSLGKVFACGVIAGGLAFLLLPLPSQGMILVGASGGIFALLLWLTTVSPQSRMWPVPLSAKNLGLGLLFASGGLALLAAWLPPGGIPVAHGCHFGGALAGWVMARRLLRSPVTLERLRKERARRESADGPQEDST